MQWICAQPILADAISSSAAAREPVRHSFPPDYAASRFIPPTGSIPQPRSHQTLSSICIRAIELGDHSMPRSSR